MPGFEFIGFAQPWLLLALASLPVLWWLLRVTPPSPKKQLFPALRLLAGLQVPDETPARTPWWLLALRLAIAALIILAMAQPLLNPAQPLYGSGPVVVAVDDGWASARSWSKRQAAMEKLLSQAGRENRRVILLPTAPDALNQAVPPSGLLPPAEALRSLRAMKPKPWPADRAGALAALETLELEGSAQAFWFTDGLVFGAEEDGMASARALAARLQRFGRLDLVSETAEQQARLLLPPENEGIALLLRLQRPPSPLEESAAILSIAGDGQTLGRTPVTFAPGEVLATARLELPAELRNRIARLQVEGESSAGAVLLMDERWRRRPVGLVDTAAAEAQPLLTELYYLERALEPFTELRRGSVTELLQRELAVLVLPDSAGNIAPEEADLLNGWIERGGMLVRFAGPRLAEGADDFLPVRLRGGDRVLGGAMTWDTPAHLAPFKDDSPFAGLAIRDEVIVQRQVLAEPSLDLGDRTWARLTDGTPLVTAKELGDGWVTLFHTSANTDWSNISLSGLFVDMLRRLLDVSQGVASGIEGRASLAPIETLDGFGVLGSPAATVGALEIGSDAPAPRITALTPPGYYGLEGQRQAHNLGDGEPALHLIGGLPAGVNQRSFAEDSDSDLRPWLLTAALILAIADLVISLALRGLLPWAGVRPAAKAAGTAGLLAALLLIPDRAPAQSLTADQRAVQATSATRLAYVRTDVPYVDDTSMAGLSGLTLILQRRTSIDAAPPMAVDLPSDELSFFPLLYWPITPQQEDLDERSRRKVNEYLKNGGTILFDLREPSGSLQALGQSTTGTQALQRLTQGLDVPALVPVPPEHVITKSFYLMQEYPGRYAGATLWVEGGESQTLDGVASVIVGSNDWAGAWAVDEKGRPVNALVPGGQRQRELAYRFGVNLVMYALTGNYKADQVHVPFILERLGQ